MNIFDKAMSEYMMNLLLRLLEDFGEHGMLRELGEHIHALMDLVQSKTETKIQDPFQRPLGRP